MQLFIVFLAALTASLALPLDEFETIDDGETQYLLVPLSRTRRDTTVGVGSPGVTGSVSHTGTIFENDRHRLDGSAHASKDFSRGGRPDLGGGLSYGHKPSGSAFTLDANRGQRGGVDVGATGRYSIYQSKNWDVGAGVSYDKFHGSKPSYGGFLGVTGRF